MREPSGQPDPGMPDTTATLLAAIQSLEDAASESDMTRRLIQLYKASLANPVSGREHLVFTIGGISCAVPLAELQEVRLNFPALTPLPFSPPWLLGIFEAHSEPAGLVDLAGYMGLDSSALAGTPRERAILLARTAQGMVGLAVGQVGEILHIGDEHRHDPPAPGLIPERLARYVLACAVVPDQQASAIPTLLLLDLPRLLQDLLAPAANKESDD